MDLRKFKHIIFKSSWQFILIIAGLLILMILYRYSFQGKNFWESFYHYIDPVASIMTFVTTMVILYIQAKTKWENGIEKRLSVKYIYVGEDGNDKILVAEVIDAYLPGESDVRAWAQSLGQQMMGFLDFDMHWDESTPKIKYNEKLKNYIKAYSISVYLTTNPTDNEVMKKFKQRKFKHSEITIVTGGSSIKWTEKF